MSKVVLLLAATLIVFLPMPAAQAHVLLRDDTQQVGALLHIQPDDDPIAGEEARLYFDLQPVPAGELTATLTVRTELGSTENIATTIDAGTISASYVFPAQGLYTLRLTVTADSATHVFTYMQRVSRGIAHTAVQRQTHGWAELTLAVAASGFVILLVLYIRNRKAITNYSR